MASGFAQEEDKSRFFNGGWAAAGAGDGEAVKSVFSRLDQGTVHVSAVEDEVKRTLEELNRISEIKKIEIIIVVSRNHNVEASVVEKTEYGFFFCRPMTSNHKCAGELTPRIVAEHYLKERDYYTEKCEQAAPEILAILKRACKEGSYVGSQEDYGLDILILRANDYFEKRRSSAITSPPPSMEGINTHPEVYGTGADPNIITLGPKVGAHPDWKTYPNKLGMEFELKHGTPLLAPIDMVLIGVNNRGVVYRIQDGKKNSPYNDLGLYFESASPDWPKMVLFIYHLLSSPLVLKDSQNEVEEWGGKGSPSPGTPILLVR